MIRTVIAVPNTGYIHHSFFTRFALLQKGSFILADLSRNAIITNARNFAVNIGLEHKADYILFLDSDETFDDDLLVKLIHRSKDIVGGLIFRRKPPFDPCAYELKENKFYRPIPIEKETKGLLEVDAIGTGALLIKMDVFRKLPKPWFYFTEKGFGEDLNFCRNAKEAGYKIYVDCDIEIGHIGDEIIIDRTVCLDYQAAVRAKDEKWIKKPQKLIVKGGMRNGGLPSGKIFQ